MKDSAVFFTVIIFLACAASAYAHPPYDIKITFDPKTKMLQAVIIHNVNDPLKHYIRKVDIGLNGKEIIEQRISRQDNSESQTVHYLIPDVKNGDALSVEGYCNISGKLKKEITVKNE
jgi:desulfoferrodoxin (superoxide reductase-like protein)